MCITYPNPIRHDPVDALARVDHAALFTRRLLISTLLVREHLHLAVGLLVAYDLTRLLAFTAKLVAL